VSEEEPPPKPIVPFQERLHPGMIVRIMQRSKTDFLQYAMILCPEGAFGKDQETREEMSRKRRYICAQISPAVMADAYNLAMEHRKVIAVEDMEAEASMEWDAPTRYWFMTI
jgi:kinesin family member 2/24